MILFGKYLVDSMHKWDYVYMYLTQLSVTVRGNAYESLFKKFCCSLIQFDAKAKCEHIYKVI